MEEGQRPRGAEAESPTARADTLAQPEPRRRGQRMRRGTEEGQSITHADRMHPEATQSAHRGTGAAHAAGSCAGLPSHPHALTAPPEAPQATTDSTGRGASTHRTPCPQRAHRCPTERGAGRGVQLPTRSTRTSHSRPVRAAEGARRIYLNMYRGTAAEPETRTAQGVAGTPRKKSSEFEKSVDRGMTPGVYFKVSRGHTPADRAM